MTMMMTKCGYVAIVGRPNVGKSTLLNCVLQQKLCITSSKPQTTRHRILGVQTNAEVQSIYVDTPGIHQRQHRALNRHMNQVAMRSVHGVDVILFLLDARVWKEADAWVLQQLQNVQCPVLLVLNKVDKIADKTWLLPHIDALKARYAFAEIIPISAKTKDNVAALEQAVARYLPQQAHVFAADAVTDRSERFLVAELVREKLFRGLGQELPYSLTVEVESFKEEEKLTRIGVIVWVEKMGQKGIVIGKNGERLKIIATKARTEMETLLQRKVFLQVWVKVKDNWADDERALQSLGYG